MSQAHVRTSSQQSAQEAARQQFARLLDLGPTLAATTLEATRNFVETASGLIAEALPASALSGTRLQVRPTAKAASGACCEIPETECPPRCPCAIEWKACHGERLKCRIRVTNTSEQTRAMKFHATPFKGGSKPPDASLDIQPGEADLQPGESVTLNGELTVAESFEAGQEYFSEVIIRSDHEQCVKVRLCVEHDCTVHCEIDHGERPVRIRAHRWYDHFQCVEPCPSHRHPSPPVDERPEP